MKIEKHHVLIAIISLIVGVMLGMGMIQSRTSASGGNGVGPVKNTATCSLIAGLGAPMTVDVVGQTMEAGITAIKWGDGTTTTGSRGPKTTFKVTHTYRSPNMYTILGTAYPLSSNQSNCSVTIKVQ